MSSAAGTGLLEKPTKGQTVVLGRFARGVGSNLFSNTTLIATAAAEMVGIPRQSRTFIIATSSTRKLGRNRRTGRFSHRRRPDVLRKRHFAKRVFDAA